MGTLNSSLVCGSGSVTLNERSLVRMHPMIIQQSMLVMCVSEYGGYRSHPLEKDTFTVICSIVGLTNQTRVPFCNFVFWNIITKQWTFS